MIARAAIPLASIALVLLGCTTVGPTPSAAPGAQVVRVVVDDEVRLDPPSVNPGDVEFVLDYARDDTQHGPEGLFFVSRGGDPDAPKALRTQDVGSIEQGTDEGLAFDGGWGQAPMRMTLLEGQYAFILRSADAAPHGRPPASIAVLDVLQEGP